MDSRSNEVPKHTPGPWYTDSRGQIWRRPINELYEYGGGVMGDKPLASVARGWYKEDEAGYPVEANAQLIAAAPEMLEALKRMLCDAVYNAEYDKWTIDMSDFVLEHNKQLIAKAEGRTP
jgi:hypothetical protein